MAPELAINYLRMLKQPSIVLDPMVGAGTVIRHAADMGNRAIGFDLDPLAVLISRVWTQPIRDQNIEATYNSVLKEVLTIDPLNINLPWVDSDHETESFINYWFGKQQQQELRRISYVIYSRSLQTDNKLDLAALDVLRVALSRIIITKEQCASLARDTSHSRPHRVTTSSNYSVFNGFEKSVKIIRKRLLETPPHKAGKVNLGDARHIKLPTKSVDLVITSPPYLNAIDYLRGHRLSLVWLGHRLSDLRDIRSNSIGAERGIERIPTDASAIVKLMGNVDELPSRYQGMVKRYARDLLLLMHEISRVLKPASRAIFVIGNSCLRNIFIRNSEAVVKAAQISGLKLINRFERELPVRNRYLPLTEIGSLGKRMRTETILDLEPA